MAEYYGVQRSEEYLAHYGILGMHWGHRKVPELKPSPINKSDKLNSLNSQIHKMENDFYKNEDLVDKHRKACAKDMAKRWMQEGGGQFKDYNDAYKNAYMHYKHGDFDQGSNSTFEHYLSTNQKARKKYIDLQRAHTAEFRRLNPRFG